MSTLRHWTGSASNLIAEKWLLLGVLVSFLLVVSACLSIAIWLIPPRGTPSLQLISVEYDHLHDWNFDHQGQAIAALLRSCSKIVRYAPSRAMGPRAVAGYARDWFSPCNAAETVEQADHIAARAFFQKWFKPYLITYEGKHNGLFTGYYEPTLEGSLSPDSVFRIPLLARPKDLVSVSLGRFRDEWKGERTAGVVKKGRLEPYFSRAEIEDGRLRNKGLELVWVKDPIDAFFMHIQGSGRISLPDGKILRLGYDSQNGHSYTSIGKELVNEGAIKRADVSMQSIKAWLQANPDRRSDILNRNASYVFFRFNSQEGPVGAANVVLTPLRSIAVDLRFLPLGVPLWLETGVPGLKDGEVSFRRLMIAQDTGGAIRGAIRGDVFWGATEDAAEIAGRMKSIGRYYVLLPRGISDID